MAEALDVGGTSFDALYVNVNGESGYFERGLDVYGQEGSPCPRRRPADPSRAVHEPFVVPLPEMSAGAATRPLVSEISLIDVAQVDPAHAGVTLKDGTHFRRSADQGRHLPEPFRRTAQWPRLF